MVTHRSEGNSDDCLMAKLLQASAYCLCGSGGGGAFFVSKPSFPSVNGCLEGIWVPCPVTSAIPAPSPS